MDVIHVLLVDDDPDVLHIMASQLRQAGLGVDVVTSAAEALLKLDQFVPELIIADVQMPGMDGYELCRAVRARGLNEIPFFFCSANGSLPQRVIGLKVGADDYLVKPVNPEELLFRVQFQLEKNRRTREAQRLAEARSGGLTGTLTELELPQLLQLMDQRGKGDVRLRIESPTATASVYVSGRSILHVTHGAHSGEKALLRILAMADGEFSVEPNYYVGDRTIEGRIDELLLSGLAQLDEYRLLRQGFDQSGDFIFVRYGKELFSRRFEPITLAVLALIEEHHVLDRILDASPYTDLVTLRIVSELIQVGLSGATERPVELVRERR